MDELIKGEICIREMAMPSEVRASKKLLAKWICLSIGVINPRDKRDGIVDIFWVLLESLRDSMPLSVEEITRRVNRRREKPISEKTTYYHLKRLKEMGLLTKTKEGYILGDGHQRELTEIIRKAFKDRMDKILTQIEEVEFGL